MSSKKKTATKKDSMKFHGSKDFPVIGLGASAGGLEALKTFFSNAPESSGMAFIVVVHMPPDKPSLMPELLQKQTEMPVEHAKDGQLVEPDHVYIMPSDKNLTLERGKIKLLEIPSKFPHLPIDTLFHSLAKDKGARGGGVVFSGTGSDGALGLKVIKAHEGLVIVQSPDTAKYDSMPKNALATNAVDIVLPPEKMPAVIVSYFEKPQAPSEVAPFQGNEEASVWLGELFSLLRTRIGHDFSAYKRNTLLRRVQRRMGLKLMDSPEEYLRLLRDEPEEVEFLFRDLLIGVTNFFRDPESYDVLQETVLPKYFSEIKDDEVFRIWVAGCSTGEEAYSLAILFRESLEKHSKRTTLQIFGTDIDKYAIDKAREGLYPGNIASDVSPERLRRHFIKEGDYFRIRKEIRDSIVFSVQDILKDPPFSRLNMLCCRNLLIYLDGGAQKKLIPLFHYTLKPEGLLMLGSSETIGGYTNLFSTLNSKWKIFKRQEVPAALTRQVDFPSGYARTEKDATAPVLADEHGLNLGQLAKDEILERFACPALLIDADATILHVSGRLGKYLEPTSGPPSQNALDLAREGLRIELSSAIRAALANKTQDTRHDVRVRTNGDVQRINLHVCPLNAPKELTGKLLVAFEDISEDARAVSVPTKTRGDSDQLRDERLSELERELQNTRESHQTTIEELESSNEELKSTNEELQSSNEELQSTNEELESSKEELQSLNEELQTVNSELQSKVEELSAARDDMRNLLNSTEIATIFVDNAINIKRFTQEATTIINLIPSDIGRPLSHVMTNLEGDEMMLALEQVLNHLSPQEAEVQTNDQKWYKMRVMPYRTMDNRIDGAVLTFALIDDQKQAQKVLKDTNAQLGSAWQLTRKVFDLNPQPLLVVDGKGEQVLIANTKYMQFAGLELDAKAEGVGFDELLPAPLRVDDIQKAIQAAVKEEKKISCGPYEMKTSPSRKSVTVTATAIPASKNELTKVLISFEG